MHRNPETNHTNVYPKMIRIIRCVTERVGGDGYKVSGDSNKQSP